LRQRFQICGRITTASYSTLLGVADLVAGCFGKRPEPDVGVDFVVDDDGLVVPSYGGLRVEPFGADPRDEELLRVPEVVDASQRTNLGAPLGWES
jgi:hypothetical protein